MAITQQRPNGQKDGASKSHSDKIDPNAMAGTTNSLGEESVREGRPTTDDSVVEAIDEETPATPATPER